MLAAVPAQSADRRPAGDVGLRPRRAPDRSLAARADEAARRGRRVRAPRADARRRRRSPDAGSRGAPRNARGAAAAARSAATSASACSPSASTTPPSAADIDGERRRGRRRVRDRARAVPPAPDRRAAARRPRAARRVHRQPLGDAEPRGRARHLLPRRQPAVRRRSHVGLDSRSARAPSRAAGLVGPRRRRARRPRRRRRSRRRPRRSRCAATRAEIVSPAERRRHGDGHRAAARLPPRARHDRLRRRAGRDRAASSTCSIAPTSSGASSRARSRTCSCSTT